MHDNRPTTGDQSIGPFGSDPIGPTPGYNEGDLGTTPGNHQNRTPLDLTVTVYWNDAHLKRRASLGTLEAWEPVDTQNPSELLWWKANGDATRMDIHWAWRQGDSALDESTVSILL